MTMTIAPALFISHGSPMFAIEPGTLGGKLGELGLGWDGLKGIVVLSPHWQTKGLSIASNPRPKTIHDFGSFPRVLFTLDYPAPGSEELARKVFQLLNSADIHAELDSNQGLDHGVWVPLMHLRPQADIPVVPISMPVDVTPTALYALGQRISDLRKEGIAIIGSGSMTHNLYEFRGAHFTDAEPYVTEFSSWVRSHVTNRDLASLLNYRVLAPHAVRAHPTDEHFLPLFFALGASFAHEAMQVLTTEVRYGMLSMESYAWGTHA